MKNKIYENNRDINDYIKIIKIYIILLCFKDYL